MIIKSDQEFYKHELSEERLKHIRISIASKAGSLLAPLCTSIEVADPRMHCERLEFAVFSRDQFKEMYLAACNNNIHRVIEILGSTIPDIRGFDNDPTC